MRRLLFLGVLVPILFSTGYASGATYNVATTGNDSNAGTAGAPWRTMQKAANTAVAGDTVLVGGGTYNATVTFPHSGSAGNKITFKNVTGALQRWWIAVFPKPRTTGTWEMVPTGLGAKRRVLPLSQSCASCSDGGGRGW